MTKKPQPLTVTLTPHQAQALVTICDYIGGDHTGYRGDMEELAAVLHQAGYQPRKRDLDFDAEGQGPQPLSLSHYHGLYFKNRRTK